MGTGFTAKVQTSNPIVRTEAMTLRVWRARIESVVFGKEGQRQITAMFSTDKESKELAQHLADFGRNRSSLVAPDSPEDMNRIAALANAERALASASGAPSLVDIGLAALAGSGAGQPPAQIADNGQKAKFCRHCGAKNAFDARFCQGCGEKFES
jgi:ribosomal protein L40E